MDFHFRCIYISVFISVGINGGEMPGGWPAGRTMSSPFNDIPSVCYNVFIKISYSECLFVSYEKHRRTHTQTHTSAANHFFFLLDERRKSQALLVILHSPSVTERDEG